MGEKSQSVKDMVRWLSGRKRRFAKALYPLKGTQGSNPCLTAVLIMGNPLRGIGEVRTKARTSEFATHGERSHLLCERDFANPDTGSGRLPGGTRSDFAWSAAGLCQIVGCL